MSKQTPPTKRWKMGDWNVNKSSMEMSEAGHCFLSSLFGASQYHRWCVLMKQQAFTSQLSFVKWLMDCAESRRKFGPTDIHGSTTHRSLDTAHLTHKPHSSVRQKPRQFPQVLNTTDVDRHSANELHIRKAAPQMIHSPPRRFQRNHMAQQKDTLQPTPQLHTDFAAQSSQVQQTATSHVQISNMSQPSSQISQGNSQFQQMSQTLLPPQISQFPAPSLDFPPLTQSDSSGETAEVHTEQTSGGPFGQPQPESTVPTKQSLDESSMEKARRVSDENVSVVSASQPTLLEDNIEAIVAIPEDGSIQTIELDEDFNGNTAAANAEAAGLPGEDREIPKICGSPSELKDEDFLNFPIKKEVDDNAENDALGGDGVNEEGSVDPHSDSMNFAEGMISFPRDCVEYCEVDSPVIPGRKVFKCVLCPYTNFARQHVVRHFQTHTGARPFPCFACKTKYSQKHHLKRHLAPRNFGLPKHRCNFCGVQFANDCGILWHNKFQHNFQ